MTRAAIFDLDDTLYAYDDFIVSGFRAVGAHVATLSQVGATDIVGLLRHFRLGPERGREFQALCETLSLSPALVPQLVHVFRAHRPTLSLSRDAATTLDVLRARGWRLGILTNGLATVQRGKVCALGLNALVDCVVYADDHAAGGKPARAAFAAVTRDLGVDPARAVMVGNDLECDIRGAERAGLCAIHVHAASGSDPSPDGVWDRADLVQVPALAEHLVLAEGVYVH